MLGAAEALKHVLARAARGGAHAADALLFESDSLETRVRGSEIDFVKQARERSLGLRAFVKGPSGLRCAVASSSDLSAGALDRLADDALALAAATAEDPDAGLPERSAAPYLPDLGLLDPADRATELEVRIEEARRAEAAARAVDPRVTNSEGSEATSGFARTLYGDSQGLFVEFEAARHSLFCMPIAAENGAMQVDHWSTAARRRADMEPPEEVGRRAAERALRRLGSRRVPTCEVPVVFDPLAARSLLGHLAACVSGAALYRRTSCLAGRLGQRVASDLVEVVDDGRMHGGLGTRPFDGEGLPTRRTTVVDRGQLTSFLLDTYSARKLGLASTASALRAPGGPPSPGPSNFWLLPGETSPEAMIAGIERGLLVTWLFGHGFNPLTGDFSRGAAGLWIEDGRLAYPVHEVTVAGNLLGMLSAVDAVGNDLVCVGTIAAPSLRVARMTVAGE
jgi:PmbA protein